MGRWAREHEFTGYRYVGLGSGEVGVWRAGYFHYFLPVGFRVLVGEREELLVTI